MLVVPTIDHEMPALFFCTYHQQLLGEKLKFKTNETKIFEHDKQIHISSRSCKKKNCMHFSNTK